MPTGLGDEQLWLCPTLDNSPNDISGNNNNGVYNGGMGTVADTSEGGSLAYDLDGIDDYLKVDNSIEFGAVSVSCWAYSDLTFPTFRVIDLYDLSRSTGSPDVVIQHINYSSYRAFSQISGAPTTASHSVTPAQWHHLCTVFDGTNLNLYVDGSLAVSAACTVTPQSDQAFFGSRTGTGEYMDGKMDDIRSYSRALTPAEISWLATERGVLGTPPEGLGDEQLWLCPSIQDSANDLSGNNNNGVYQGGMGTVADVSEGGSLAYDFDGTDDYIDCGDILGGTSGGNDTAVTYASWMKLDSYSNNINGYGTAWMGKSDGVSVGGYTINSINGLVGIARFPYNSTGAEYLETKCSASQVPLTTWKHVAVTYSGCETTGCTTIYIDGVAVSVNDTDSSYGTGMGANTNSFKVGTTLYQMQFRRMMNGQLDDIRVYDRVLTQAEITHLASQRGVLGAAPVGLGTEKTWLCPSLLDAPTDITGNKTYSYAGGLATVANTDSGGSRAYDFDNTSAKAVLQSSNEVIDDTDSFSLSWWMNISSASNSINYYVYDCRSGGSRGWGVTFRSDGVSMFFGTSIYRGSFDQDAAAINVGSKSSFINASKFCVMNWDNGTNTWSCYIDGVFAGSYAASVAGGSANPSGTYGAVGNYPTLLGVGYLPDVLVDDVRVHNRTLTQAEITHLASQRGVLGTPDTCDMLTDMTYWSDFDDAASSMADENGGSDTLDATLSPAVESSGSPRSSDCTYIVNGYYSLNGGASQPAPPSDYSFSIWAKCTGSGSTGAWIANQRLSGATSGWNIFRRSSNGLVSFMELAGGVAARTVEVTPMSLNTWYLLSFSRNDAGLYAYVNGSLVGSDTTSMTQGTDAAPLVIGGAAWDAANSATKYNGYLWSCGMWDRVLTASEHSQLYQSGQGLLYSEICSSGPPPSVFFNPFKSNTFFTLDSKRIR